ncbi:MAG TPA: DNA repair protein RecO [Caproicibacter sp.]|nr:DNA repair protein RecO [Caproicibacter sp.]
MKMDAQGLVVSEKSVGENDRLVTILTREKGILRAFVRQSRRSGGGKVSAARLFTYSRFTIFEGRDSYIIDDAQPIEVFFDLRKDIGRLSLAQYFCELAASLAPQDAEAGDFLRLLLNAMYFLCKGTRTNASVKSIVEMRMMSLAGYMPDLIYCAECKCYEADLMLFLPRSGKIFCSDCYHPQEHAEPAVSLSRGAMTALRHTIYADFDKLFSFRVSPAAERELAEASERYVLETLQRRFNTLEFYHQMVDLPASPAEQSDVERQ